MNTIQIGKKYIDNSVEQLLTGVDPSFTLQDYKTLLDGISPPEDKGFRDIYLTLENMTQNELNNHFSLKPLIARMQEYVNICNQYYPPPLAIIVGSWICAWHCRVFMHISIPFINKALFLYGANAYNTAKQVYSDMRMAGCPVNNYRPIEPWPETDISSVWGQKLTILDYNTDISTQLKNKIFAKHSEFTDIDYMNTIRDFIASQNSMWFDTRGPLMVITQESYIDIVHGNQKVIQIKC